MTLSTHNEIKQIIKDDWAQFADNAYPHDLLNEFADSATPIYYSDIISEWQQMPSEFNDSWQDLGTDGSAGIMQLMQMDLYNYYSHAYLVAYNELAEEMEPQDA